MNLGRQGRLLSAMTIILMAGDALAQTTITWNSQTGNWSDSTRWSPGFVPNNGSPSPGDTFTAVVANNGTATVDIPVTIESLTLNGGTIDRQNDITLNQSLLWSKGTFSGTGTVSASQGITISGTGSKSMSQGKVVNGGSGTATFSGTLTLSNGAVIENLSGKSWVDNTAGATFAGGSTTTFKNAGTYQKISTTTTTFQTAFENTGTLAIDAGSMILDTGSSLSNSGTVNINGGSLIVQGTTGISGSGSINVNSGSLVVQALTGSTSGNVSVAEGAMMTVDKPFVVQSVAGSGYVKLDSNSKLTVNGDYQAATTTIRGTNLFQGTFSSDSVAVSHGTSTFQGDASIQDLSITKDQAAGTKVVFNGNTSISNSFAWTEGEVSGTGTTVVANGATFTINGGVLSGGQKLINNTSASLTGSMSFKDGSYFQNNGTLSIVGQSSFASAETPSGSFVNVGTLVRSGSGITGFDSFLVFSNKGLVQVDEGTLEIDNGSSTGGAFVVNAGATLNLGLQFTSDSTSSISGAGNVIFQPKTPMTVQGDFQVTGATTIKPAFGNPASSVTMTKNITFVTLNLDGADASLALVATGTNTISSSFNWSGGTLGGTGTTTIPATAVLAFNGTNEAALDGGHTLVNNSQTPTELATKSLALGGGATYINNGSFYLSGQSLNVKTGGGTFRNAGTFQSDSSGENLIANDITLLNSGEVVLKSGTLNVIGTYRQTAGSTTLNGGALKSSLGGVLLFEGGTLAGSGTIQGAVTAESATLSPGMSAGALAIAGNLSVTSNTDWKFEIGGTGQGTTFDFLSEGGDVALDLNGGTLILSLINGFVPDSSMQFVIVESNDAIAGSFGNMDGSGRVAFDSGSFAVLISENQITLTDFQSVPEPGTIVLTLAALIFLGGGIICRGALRRS